MTKDLKVLESKEVLGNTVFNIYGTVDEPLFLAKDIATIIEHSKTSMMLAALDSEEKLRETIFTSGQNREMWFVTEDGLYEILMTSRKPIAKQFKKEVKLILKTIRKTGGYIADGATKEQVEHLAENNLIELCNSGRQPGKRFDTLFSCEKPSGIQSTLDYVYPKIKSEHRDYFLTRLKAYVTKARRDYGMAAMANDTYNGEVYAGYTTLLLFCTKEHLKFTNRSTGKIIANLEKKVEELTPAIAVGTFEYNK